ncbi:hypothetical protein [Dyadobacter tibetensis]|uniref:hypothetical protein n=1 Tax=Dyadobacter tibetensis TaxID=1211851 RepID=UPI000472ADCB|nr:hypothetical protein [Dyadobacter tibetensis]
MKLEEIYNRFILKIERALDTNFWLWKLVGCCVVLTLFLAFPPYSLLFQHFSAQGAKLDAWTFIHNQAQDLLHPADFSIGVRREAMVFRWVLPGLYRLFGENLILILFLQFGLAVGFLYRVGSFAYTLFQDKVITALILFSISNTFVGVWGFADIHGYGDIIAYFLLLWAITSRNWILIFLAMLGAYFTDERAVVAGGYVLIFWAVSEALARGRADFKSLIKTVFTGRSTAVWLAWVVYLSVRLYIKLNYFQQHHYSAVGMPVMLENQHRSGLGSSLWSVFEGLWLVLIAAFTVLWLQSKRWISLFFLSGFLVLLTTGLYVHDVDRAFGYGFPFILLSLVILKYCTDRVPLQLILFFCMNVCVAQLQVFTMGYNVIVWVEPLPIKALIFLSRYLGWGIFV